ncbi:MAG: hypothetical protein COZ76_11470 [Flavobacteriales bacterium CG_4_8_14_3_um_filter_35_10]|nr:MAG: hypothetical protein COZ76_11470 [Flavobacteriales bacterium CG_4_8_14_3_um_filter_35_10]
MQKKSQEKLKDLAIAILTLKADADINLLKIETQQLYEELCVLEYLSKLPKQEAPIEIEAKRPTITPPIEAAEPPKKIATGPEHFSLFSIKDEIGVDANFEDIFIKKETQILTQSNPEPVDEPSTLKDKIEAAKQSEIHKLFNEPITNNPDISTVTDIQTKIHRSLNDKINQQFIAVDLNDRIAFVKHLFDNSQEDFNRVLSQLNSFENEIEAKDFLLTQVKPDYSWEGKELYEARLLFLIERKFM